VVQYENVAVDGDDGDLLTANITSDIGPNREMENEIRVEYVFRRRAFAYIAGVRIYA
jgi:hypothetical protein